MFRFIKARTMRAKADLFHFAREHLLVSSLLALLGAPAAIASYVIATGGNVKEQVWQVVAYSGIGPLAVFLIASVVFYILAGGRLYAEQRAEIARLQPAANPADEDPRMNFAELVEFAERECGWNIRNGGEGLEVLDLRDWVVDVSGIGRVKFYGRLNPRNLSFIGNITLTEIPISHWVDHELDVFDALYRFYNQNSAATNLQARSRPRPNPSGQYQVYCDIHLDRQQAKRFLKIDGERFRGQNARERDHARQAFEEAGL
jgi:hypothetical protein